MPRLFQVEAAIAALDGGGIVAVPTDTVYGFAAEMSQPSAVAALFTLKHRPTSIPIPAMVDSVEQIRFLGVEWPEAAQRLADAFWPGALTIIVPVPHELAVMLGGERDAAGFRIPDDDDLRRMMAVLGPFAVTSANEYGEKPCYSAQEVLKRFASRQELSGAIDGGERSGDVSSVVDLSVTPWRVLREGAVSSEEFARVIDG
jgi:tRNA threonylcarbamoyl adenosine modification protein (Sua5/YciO/YrdC/YwlC family)